MSFLNNYGVMKNRKLLEKTEVYDMEVGMALGVNFGDAE